jgi:hypothetical protein
MPLVRVLASVALALFVGCGHGKPGGPPGPGSDAGESDAGSGDSGSGDAGSSDAGVSGGGVADAGSPDAGSSDAGSDGGAASSCHAGCPSGFTCTDGTCTGGALTDVAADPRRVEIVGQLSSSGYDTLQLVPKEHGASAFLDVSNGAFAGTVSPGTYDLVAWAGDAQAQVAQGQPLELDQPDLQIQAPQLVQVDASIQVAGTPVPCAGAGYITLEPTDGSATSRFSPVCDASGNVALSAQVPARSYRVRIEKAVPAQPLAVLDVGPLTVEVGKPISGLVLNQPAYDVSGTVVIDGGTKTCANFSITVWLREQRQGLLYSVAATCPGSGTATFTAKVLAGTYSAELLAPALGGNVREVAGVSLPIAADTQGVALPLQANTVSVSGKVTLAGATVQSGDCSPNSSLHLDFVEQGGTYFNTAIVVCFAQLPGQFSVKLLPGTYQVTLSAVASMPPYVFPPLQVSAGGATGLVLDAPRAAVTVDVSLPAGTVHASCTADPPPNLVTLDAQGQYQDADAKCPDAPGLHFELGLWAGSYELHVQPMLAGSIDVDMFALGKLDVAAPSTSLARPLQLVPVVGSIARAAVGGCADDAVTFTQLDGPGFRTVAATCAPDGRSWTLSAAVAPGTWRLVGELAGEIVDRLLVQ